MDENQVYIGLGGVMSIPKPGLVLMESFEQVEQEILNGHEDFILCYEAHKINPETKIQETVTLKEDLPIETKDPMSFVVMELLMKNPRVRILKV